MILVLSLFLSLLLGAAVYFAIRNGREYRKNRLTTLALERAVRIPAEMINELNLDRLLVNIVEILRTNLKIDECTIVLADEKGALGTGKGICFGDEIDRSAYGELPSEGDGHVRAVSGRRIVAGLRNEDKDVGAIFIARRPDRPRFKGYEREFLSAVAPRLASTLRNAIKYRELILQFKRQNQIIMISEHGFTDYKTAIADGKTN